MIHHFSHCFFWLFVFFSISPTLSIFNNTKTSTNVPKALTVVIGKLNYAWTRVAAINVKTKLVKNACWAWNTIRKRSYVKVATNLIYFLLSLNCFLIFLCSQTNFIQSNQFSRFQSDINECEFDPESCDDGYKCVNTVGAFECIQWPKPKPKYEKEKKS